MAMLDELIGYIKSHDGVWFAHHLDVAEEWRRRQEQAGTWEEAEAAVR
jgi:hypothetical protein